ncbi:hypothetical protein QEH52_13920 [Coraliomargarita sp. SDUM461003]|uniref:DUF4440 domain-containing protein n=1 Tax=Thalassobacterium maritimum TaxID=3041265 RepID=A0ABU1AWT5_9BACT|nr:hypothetical protein [Coraliomargarita sp. SDUM461003]MDQ8208618.1 hypothetical protein [Coraliomargarita sp. SDUM461003]
MKKIIFSILTIIFLSLFGYSEIDQEVFFQRPSSLPSAINNASVPVSLERAIAEFYNGIAKNDRELVNHYVWSDHGHTLPEDFIFMGVFGYRNLSADDEHLKLRTHRVWMSKYKDKDVYSILSTKVAISAGDFYGVSNRRNILVEDRGALLDLWFLDSDNKWRWLNIRELSFQDL